MVNYVQLLANNASPQSKGIVLDSEELMKIYDDIDTSGDGEIEYSEFIAAAMNK